jgi:N-acylglucosamine-6-phosphate 2-epimerase
VPGESPDFDLLGRILAGVETLVIAEGHYWRPEELVRALHIGAHAVVIGAAITDPYLITTRFLDTVKSWSPLR